MLLAKQNFIPQLEYVNVRFLRLLTQQTSLVNRLDSCYVFKFTVWTGSCSAHTCHTVKLSYCHAVILSPCHTAILPRCHLVTLSYCHDVILSPCHAVILSNCHTVTLSNRNNDKQKKCKTVILKRSQKVTMSRCHDVTLSYCHTIIQQQCKLLIVFVPVCCGVYQNCLYGMAGSFPMKYTNAVILGSVSNLAAYLIDFRMLFASCLCVRRCCRIWVELWHPLSWSYPCWVCTSALL